MKRIGILLCVLGLYSCEKNINFKLKAVPGVLVVDASIEAGQPPVVVLSKSFSYFSRISPEALDTSFVHNASVTISDGSQSQALKEYTVDSAAGYTLWYYSVDTANIASPFMGAINTTYALKIIANGQEYDATTSIPEPGKKLDSVWWKPTPFATDTTDVDVYVRATDPPGLGNYVRYFTKVNSQPFLPGQQSVFDDELIDGTTYDLKVTPGIDRNNPVSFDKNFFHRGDTVTLKVSSIDKSTYEFWLTMEFAYQSIGNPFASPNKVLGNISNGALGAFCGYAPQYKTLIIPK
ncbi:MAG TPA: DUF4249 domain-containing protein [Chitinophagaceae bacterium]|nr:DUF4249 domain-containing protein [Chitinophagaceae bacterium]